jgi:hypothetical protein
MIEPGTVFANRFEIERPAGSGGMGDVYRARDRYTGAPVALKLMQAQGASAHAEERFAREARLLAELRHPGIVAYVAHGRAPDGRDFLAMEWLDGEDLGARLRRGPLSIGESVRLIERVADALAAAHGKGVVHRDLKPPNLFLPGGDVGAPKLLDFGIARRVVASRAMTGAGLVIGTPDYMAPEQARGDREITPAADVFSLGCVLYECLAGQPPFGGEHVAAVLARILFEDPPPIETLRPGLPAALGELLGRMLAKYPAQRPADAAELHAALGALGEMPELPDLPFAATLRGAPAAAAFGAEEQGLMSLVFAAPAAQPSADGTLAEADESAEAERRSALRSALHAVGARVELLADGSLVAMVPAAESAVDQAAHAARAALLVKELWPAADVALCTGRGAVRGRLPVGEVIDQAVRLLSSRASPSSAPSGSASSSSASSSNGDAAFRETAPGEATPAGETAGQDRSAVSPMSDRAPRSGETAGQDRSAVSPMSGRTPGNGVRLDKLTAGLLGQRFALSPAPEGALLVGAEPQADVARPLLGKPTPCVGREAELGTLEAQLAACIEEPEARAVLVTAPPGTGKSRLRHEFLHRVAQRSEAPLVLSGRGDLMSAGAPYGVLRPAFEQLFDLQRGEPAPEQQARLLSRVALRVPPEDRRRIAEMLGELCGVPFPAEASALLQAARNDPKIMRDQVQRAFVDWLHAELADAPALLVLDDLHWGDALTVALVDHALRELSGAPLFVLALARPEVHETFPRLWHGHRLQTIALKGLGKKACERLIRDVLGKRDAAVVARIAEQAAGNALFLEELIRAEAEGVTGAAGAQPDTVVAMLQARIGRFEPGPRRALRAASVLGPTFWRGGVAAILGAQAAAAEVDDWLDALVHAEVIEPLSKSRLRGEKEYAFRHALVRDAAYGLLTASDRTTGHRLAGEFLAASGEADPLAIADHFERGEDRPRAATFYVRAAELAMEVSDLEGAERCAARGVACGAEGEALGTLRSIEGCVSFWRLRDDGCLAGAEVALPLLRQGSRAWTRIAWAAAFVAPRGPAAWQARAPELIASFVRSEPEPDARAAHLEGLLWMTNFATFARSDAEVWALEQRMADIVARDGGRSPGVERWLLAARTAALRWLSPRPWALVREAEKAMELCRKAGDVRLLAPTTMHREIGLAEMGDADGALERLRPLLSLPQLGQDDLYRWLLLHHVAAILLLRGDGASLAEAEQILVGMLGSGMSPGFLPALSLATLVKVKLLRGEPDEATARRAHAIVRRGLRGGACTIAPLVRVLLAERRAAKAAEVAAEGLDILRQVSVGWQEIELRLAASEALHAAGDVDRARGELSATLRRIAVRAEDIEEPAWRERYLSKNADNARARALAAAWGVELDAAAAIG